MAKLKGILEIYLSESNPFNVRNFPLHRFRHEQLDKAANESLISSLSYTWKQLANDDDIDECLNVRWVTLCVWLSSLNMMRVDWPFIKVEVIQSVPLQWKLFDSYFKFVSKHNSLTTLIQLSWTKDTYNKNIWELWSNVLKV